jgi:hypothetical protein
MSSLFSTTICRDYCYFIVFLLTIIYTSLSTTLELFLFNESTHSTIMPVTTRSQAQRLQSNDMTVLVSILTTSSLLSTSTSQQQHSLASLETSSNSSTPEPIFSDAESLMITSSLQIISDPNNSSSLVNNLEISKFGSFKFISYFRIISS